MWKTSSRDSPPEGATAFCLLRGPALPYFAGVNLRASHSRFGFAGVLLLAGLLLWAVAAWPLPRLFSRAIPYTDLCTEPQTVRPIASGDHLQLLYHFWLGLDALTGRSPLGFNVYEFNLGDDSARRQPDLYYLPFSLIYAAIAPFAGHAAGWNAAGLAAVLLGVLALGLLARRFTDSLPAALLATLVAAAFPYRWITLFTGSPTGFAMAFPPLLFYGLDRAIRDRSAAGGWLAGLALFFSYTTDMHVFYFSALAAPCFALLSFARNARATREWPGQVRRLVFPLLPFVLLALAAVGVSRLMSRHLADSAMAGGRTLAEVCQYSPPAVGLVSSENLGMANHVYFGAPLFALLGAGLVLWMASFFRRGADARPGRAEIAAVAALALAVAGVILLALGAYAPWSGLPIRAARRLVPQYTMIRQTVKIYCLMPALLAPLLAALFGGIFRAGERPALRRAAAGLAVALALWTFAQALAQTRPGFCRLPRENAAYAAVAADDKANAGRPAHALALPLWPGSSHWTSIYEYAVMLSRVRLVNGYAPAVPAGYFEDVFKKYESLNQGYATDEQLDGLLGLGVRHLILHANVFPEQVSPFSPAATLRALTGHPRLALLADDGQTFAFRILPKHPVEHVPHANWNGDLYASSRQWSWNPPLEIPNGQTSRLLLRAPVFPAPNLRYLLRLGPSSAQPLLVPQANDEVASITHPIPGLPDWLQADLPGPMGGNLSAISGPVALEYALLAAGELPAPGPDASIRVAPALLFHLGHSSPGQEAVSFDPETVPGGRVLHGPNLPFPPGIYDVALSYAAQGSESPGIFRILALPGDQVLAETQLAPDRDQCLIPAIAIGDAPIRFEFHYAAQAPAVLRDIRLVPSTLRLAPVR